MAPWEDASLNIDFTSLNFDRERAPSASATALAGWSSTGARPPPTPCTTPPSHPATIASSSRPSTPTSEPVPHRLPQLHRSGRPGGEPARCTFCSASSPSSPRSSSGTGESAACSQRQTMLRQLVAQRTRELEAEKAELVAAREALSHQATRDALTGIWNRPAIIDILIREMERARRSETPSPSSSPTSITSSRSTTPSATSPETPSCATLPTACSRTFAPTTSSGATAARSSSSSFPGFPARDPHVPAQSSA